MILYYTTARRYWHNVQAAAAAAAGVQTNVHGGGKEYNITNEDRRAQNYHFRVSTSLSVCIRAYIIQRPRVYIYMYICIQIIIIFCMCIIIFAPWIKTHYRVYNNTICSEPETFFFPFPFFERTLFLQRRAYAGAYHT